MRKFCKRTSALALAALLAASASGCSSGTGSQTTATPDTTAQTEISNEESKTEESKDTGEPVTIRLVHYMGEQAKRDALDAMLAAFSEAHPEIKVDVEVVASSSYIATYKNYIAAGEAPDIMFGKPQTMQEFVDGGYFMDLKDEACMANVLPMLVDECTVNGGVYGFPIDAQVKATFYNKKMFQEAGVEVPATKGELFKVCDTFMDQGVYPFVHPYNFIHGVFHELDSFFTSMAAATDNENVWMDSQNGVKDLSGNPAVVEAMEMFSKFASYKDAGDTAVDQTQGIQNFAAGQRPMYMNGGWLMGDVIAASPDGEFGMFPTPWSDNPEENKLWIGIDDVFVVSQQTEHRDEVMTLLNFFANEESSKTWMSTAKLMTSNITVPTDDADAFIKEIKSYIDNDMIVSKSLVPDYTSEYSTAFRTKLQEFVTLDDSQRDVTKLLKDIDDEIASIRQ
ncbi:extracellular solute-binding protein [Enterocloster citroniae]|jgi:ABC-type glycerol-3-phosphate transport system substrate-binding protein|uniref:ABC transporter substrate-binding protein n=1 Tax=Enterocloster citroniae TaxID=358743 RepID=UPI001D070157|nr:extracellular solute-binding protein [Enterocloster citroniae]MCB7064810.1 extracellular solute-binding protein [Enterocloster citroniae]